MEGFNVFRNSKSVYKINKKTLDGVSYLVVPVVMMVEGVHAGSQGAVYHSIDELGKYPASWNGIPVTIYHPQEDGNYISANSPDVPNVGKVYNTYVDGDKLKGEVWIAESKISEQSPLTLAYIRQGKPLDVSVGVFTDNEQTEGEWNGEQYLAIARNHRPDHLALLPGESGACSWDDGCGIRVNSSQTKNKTNENMNLSKDDEGFMDKLVANVLQNSSTLQINSVNYSELIRQIQSAINALDVRSTEQNSAYSYHYAVEIYSDYVIYEKSEQSGTTYYKQGYSVNDDGTVSLNNDAAKVKREIKYVQINKEVKKMEKSTCCLAKIEKLINNAATHFTDADKEWLLSLDESTIDKLVPREVGVNADVTAQAIQTFKNTLQTEDDFLNLMPTGMKEKFNAGLALHTEKRKNLVETIIANSVKDTWVETDLTVMTDSMLEKIAKNTVKADYSGNVSVTTNAATKDEPEVMLPYGVK